MEHSRRNNTTGKMASSAAYLLVTISALVQGSAAGCLRQQAGCDLGHVPLHYATHSPGEYDHSLVDVDRATPLEYDRSLTDVGRATPLEVVRYGNACSCGKLLPYSVEVPRPPPSQHTYSYDYKVEVPPAPVPIPTYTYGYHVEVPKEKPNPATYSYRYTVEAPPRKVPLQLYSYNYDVEVPAEKHDTRRLYGLTASVDRLLLPRKDCEHQVPPRYRHTLQGADDSYGDQEWSSLYWRDYQYEDEDEDDSNSYISNNAMRSIADYNSFDEHLRAPETVTIIDGANEELFQQNYREENDAVEALADEGQYQSSHVVDTQEVIQAETKGYQVLNKPSCYCVKGRLVPPEEVLEKYPETTATERPQYAGQTVPVAPLRPFYAARTAVQNECGDSHHVSQTHALSSETGHIMTKEYLQSQQAAQSVSILSDTEKVVTNTCHNQGSVVIIDAGQATDEVQFIDSNLPEHLVVEPKRHTTDCNEAAHTTERATIDEIDLDQAMNDMKIIHFKQSEPTGMIHAGQAIDDARFIVTNLPEDLITEPTNIEQVAIHPCEMSEVGKVIGYNDATYITVDHASEDEFLTDSIETYDQIECTGSSDGPSGVLVEQAVGPTPPGPCAAIEISHSNVPADVIVEKTTYTQGCSGGFHHINTHEMGHGTAQTTGNVVIIDRNDHVATPCHDQITPRTDKTAHQIVDHLTVIDTNCNGDITVTKKSSNPCQDHAIYDDRSLHVFDGSTLNVDQTRYDLITMDTTGNERVLEAAENNNPCHAHITHHNKDLHAVTNVDKIDGDITIIDTNGNEGVLVTKESNTHCKDHVTNEHNNLHIVDKCETNVDEVSGGITVIDTNWNKGIVVTKENNNNCNDHLITIIRNDADEGTSVTKQINNPWHGHLIYNNKNQHLLDEVTTNVDQLSGDVTIIDTNGNKDILVTKERNNHCKDHVITEHKNLHDLDKVATNVNQVSGDSTIIIDNDEGSLVIKESEHSCKDHVIYNHKNLHVIDESITEVDQNREGLTIIDNDANESILLTKQGNNPSHAHVLHDSKNLHIVDEGVSNVDQADLTLVDTKIHADRVNTQNSRSHCYDVVVDGYNNFDRVPINRGGTTDDTVITDPTGVTVKQLTPTPCHDKLLMYNDKLVNIAKETGLHKLIYGDKHWHLTKDTQTTGKELIVQPNPCDKKSDTELTTYYDDLRVNDDVAITSKDHDHVIPLRLHYHKLGKMPDYLKPNEQSPCDELHGEVCTEEKNCFKTYYDKYYNHKVPYANDYEGFYYKNSPEISLIHDYTPPKNIYEAEQANSQHLQQEVQNVGMLVHSRNVPQYYEQHVTSPKVSVVQDYIQSKNIFEVQDANSQNMQQGVQNVGVLVHSTNVPQYYEQHTTRPEVSLIQDYTQSKNIFEVQETNSQHLQQAIQNVGLLVRPTIVPQYYEQHSTSPEVNLMQDYTQSKNIFEVEEANSQHLQQAVQNVGVLVHSTNVPQYYEQHATSPEESVIQDYTQSKNIFEVEEANSQNLQQVVQNVGMLVHSTNAPQYYEQHATSPEVSLIQDYTQSKNIFEVEEANSQNLQQAVPNVCVLVHSTNVPQYCEQHTTSPEVGLIQDYTKSKNIFEVEEANSQNLQREAQNVGMLVHSTIVPQYYEQHTTIPQVKLAQDCTQSKNIVEFLAESAEKSKTIGNVDEIIETNDFSSQYGRHTHGHDENLSHTQNIHVGEFITGNNRRSQQAVGTTTNSEYSSQYYSPVIHSLNKQISQGHPQLNSDIVVASTTSHHPQDFGQDDYFSHVQLPYSQHTPSQGHAEVKSINEEILTNMEKNSHKSNGAIVISSNHDSLSPGAIMRTYSDVEVPYTHYTTSLDNTQLKNIDEEILTNMEKTQLQQQQLHHHTTHHQHQQQQYKTEDHQQLNDGYIHILVDDNTGQLHDHHEQLKKQNINFHQGKTTKTFHSNRKTTGKTSRKSSYGETGTPITGRKHKGELAHSYTEHGPSSRHRAVMPSEHRRRSSKRRDHG